MTRVPRHLLRGESASIDRLFSDEAADKSADGEPSHQCADSAVLRKDHRGRDGESHPDKTGNQLHAFAPAPYLRFETDWHERSGQKQIQAQRCRKRCENHNCPNQGGLRAGRQPASHSPDQVRYDRTGRDACKLIDLPPSSRRRFCKSQPLVKQRSLKTVALNMGDRRDVILSLQLLSQNGKHPVCPLVLGIKTSAAGQASQ
jgi:hypothetical protein